MPRAGWLAVGAVASSLTLSDANGRTPIAVAIAILAVLLISRWLPRRGRVPIAAVGLGALAIALRLAILPTPTGPIPEPAGDGPWSMQVETVGSPRDGKQTATLRSLEPGADRLRLAATLPAYPTVEPGDRLVVAGRVRPRPDSPYGQYLERIGVWGTLDARDLRVEAVTPDLGRRLERLRRGAGDALAAVLPEPEAGLAAGILIGLRDRVDRDVAAAFTTAGASHIVAISGWNIAIVAAAIAAVAGRLGRRRRAVVTAVAIVVYIVFAGASPSVLRAGAMAGVVLLARETGRAGRAAAALGWAACLLLIAEPGLIGDGGFQLSTLATAGLIAWATPLSDRLDRLGRGRLPRWLTESLGVSLAAQAATLPVVLASFGRLALIAPAINLVVVPIVAPAMAAGVVALIGGVLVGMGAPVAVGAILAAPAWVALRCIIGAVEIAASVPLASVAFEPATGTALAVALTAACAGVIAVRRRGRSRGRAGRARRARSARPPHRLPPVDRAPGERLPGRACIRRWARESRRWHSRSSSSLP